MRGSARRACIPQVDAAPSASRGAAVGQPPGVDGSRRHATTSSCRSTSSYEADVWGRIHSAVERQPRRGAGERRRSRNGAPEPARRARASTTSRCAASIASGSCSTRRCESFEQALELTQNRFRGGIASQADVAQAETQLETTRAQAVDVGRRARRARARDRGARRRAARRRSSLAVAPLDDAPPAVPAGLPSELLERRPDIAAAERRVAAANAQVGVATAAFYPRADSVGRRRIREQLARQPADRREQLLDDRAGAARQRLRRRPPARGRRIRRAPRTTRRPPSIGSRCCARSARSRISSPRCAFSTRRPTIQRRAVDAAERSLTQATNRYRGGLASYLEVIVRAERRARQPADGGRDSDPPNERQRPADEGVRRWLAGLEPARRRSNKGTSDLHLRILMSFIVIKDTLDAVQEVPS